MDQNVIHLIFSSKPGQGFWKWIKKRIDIHRCLVTAAIVPAQRTTGDVKKTTANTRRAQGAKSKWVATECLFDRHGHILKYPCSFYVCQYCNFIWLVILLLVQFILAQPQLGLSFESRKAWVYICFLADKTGFSAAYYKL